MLYRSGSDDLRKGRRGFSFCPRSESCKRALSCQSSDGYWFLAHRLFRPPAQRAWSALSSVCFDRSEYSLAPAHSFSLSLSLSSLLFSLGETVQDTLERVYMRGSNLRVSWFSFRFLAETMPVSILLTADGKERVRKRRLVRCNQRFDTPT